jgi:hypothetical protein
MEINFKRIYNVWGFYKKDELLYFSKTTTSLLKSLFQTKITLFDKQKKIIATSISNIFSLKIKVCYNDGIYFIHFHNLLYKPYITANLCNVDYKIIIHKKPCYTILAEDIQIGTIVEDSFYTFDNEKMNLNLNSNANELTIILITAFAICNYTRNETINHKYSNAIQELLPFDFRWVAN